VDEQRSLKRREFLLVVSLALLMSATSRQNGALDEALDHTSKSALARRAADSKFGEHRRCPIRMHPMLISVEFGSSRVDAQRWGSRGPAVGEGD